MFKDSIGIAKIVQAQDYDHWGIENWTSKYRNNEKSNNFKFNGIEKEVNTGFFEAKYRFFDATIGRWTLIDPKPDYDQSLYSAMRNNPIRYTDALGDTIFVNKYGYINKNDRKDNLVYMQGDKGRLKKLGELGGTIDITEIYKNLLKLNSSIAKETVNPQDFYEEVKSNGEWDFKANMKTIYGIGNDGKTQFSFGKNKMESQDIGNHHFGVVAKGYGFPEDFTLRYAGQYQIKSGTSRPEWQKTETVLTGATYGGTIYSKILIAPFGDDPRDQKYIKEGFKYYTEHKNEK